MAPRAMLRFALKLTGLDYAVRIGHQTQRTKPGDGRGQGYGAS
jgi:hypothetical protein